MRHLRYMAGSKQTDTHTHTFAIQSC